MADIEWKKFSWEVTKGLALGVAAIASFFANQHAEQAKFIVEQTKIQLDQAKAQLDKEKQQAELNMKAFEFVEKTLSLDNPEKSKGQGLAAAAIVNALTRPPLRDSLQAALGSRYPMLQGKIEDAQKFDAEEAELNFPEPSPPHVKQGSLSLNSIVSTIGNYFITSAYADEIDGYRVDIFYCEDSSHSITEKRERQAKETMKNLQIQKPSTQPRVRLLPSLVQARPGYQISSDEIRYSKADNEEQPAKILSGITKITTLHDIAYPTPKYISIFYCAKNTHAN